jgi:hypothetical protein
VKLEFTDFFKSRLGSLLEMETVGWSLTPNDLIFYLIVWLCSQRFKMNVILFGMVRTFFKPGLGSLLEMKIVVRPLTPTSIHGHLARQAQPDTSTNWHGHDRHEHDAARCSSCSCRAGTTCRARGTARARGQFFVSCRHEARRRARRAVWAVPARGPAPLLHLIQEQISQGCQ